MFYEQANALHSQCVYFPIHYGSTPPSHLYSHFDGIYGMSGTCQRD